MNSFISRLMGATALVLIATPALANKSDKIFVSQLHDKIVAARGEPGVAENGSAELDRADAKLKPLLEDLKDDDVKSVKDITGEIDALIETARTRAKIAAMKTEVAKLEANDKGRLAAAEMTAAQAQKSAALSQNETNQLRAQLHDYQMKQTQLGATLVLSDVVFATGSADLKSGAVERLRPLATYLQANPAVRVRIDGHTDAQGADSSNQTLSDRRATSVRAGMVAMGIDEARIEAIGHGEGVPVADNRTAAGRQQNRRVEVTLVGQQASNFAAQ